MTRLEIEECSMMKPFMKVVFDLDGNMDFQKRDWDAFKKKVDSQLTKQKEG